MKNSLFPQKSIIFFVLLVALLLPATGYGQTTAGSIENLTVDIWPDYDRPAVLVLLTGTLGPDVALPAQVTVPLPADATLNAVARIDDANTMIDDVIFDDTISGQLTFTAPDSRFRIEYYMPYADGENGRSFSFDWLAELSVSQIQVIVQVPAAAANLKTVPEPATVTTGPDGLQYHNLSPVAVAAGQLFVVEVSYDAQGSQLSVGSLSAAQPPISSDTEAAAADPDTSETNWPLILGAAGGVLIGAAAVWYFVSNRSGSNRVLKPQPARRTAARPQAKSRPQARPAGGAARFCHQCGQQADPGDRFCRQCGTALKGK